MKNRIHTLSIGIVFVLVALGKALADLQEWTELHKPRYTYRGPLLIIAAGKGRSANEQKRIFTMVNILDPVHAL